MEEGFRDFANKRISNPPRHEFYFNRGSVEAMSASDDKFFSCKIVNTHKDNPTLHGLPTIIANGILVDGETGYPLMITGSTILTALRTGIASAIATKYLSNNDDKTLGIIGNGAQSLPQLHAISLVRNIQNVYIYDTDRYASKSLKKSINKLFKNVDVHISSHSQDVCSHSDILVTATCKDKYTHPIIKNEWVAEGTHINAIGGDSPNKIELDKLLIDRAKLIVDFKDQAIYEGETQQVHQSQIDSDLAAIVAGLRKGRDHEKQITIFDSVGFAMEDLQVYKLIYELAIKENMGIMMSICSIPMYSKNIYKSYFNI
jgi:ornithine cyclodeaminase